MALPAFIHTAGETNPASVPACLMQSCYNCLLQFTKRHRVMFIYQIPCFNAAFSQASACGSTQVAQPTSIVTSQEPFEVG